MSGLESGASGSQGAPNVGVVPAGPSNAAALRSFLEAHVETSIFMLSVLDRYGSHLTDSPSSGELKALEEHGRCAGAFVLTRRGHLLAQTSGRRDLCPLILAACADGPHISGVVAEWNAADCLADALAAAGDFRPSYYSRTVVYRVPRPAFRLPPAHVAVRPLSETDFDQWDRLHSAFVVSEGATLSMAPTERAQWFGARTKQGHWKGAFAGGELVAIVAFDDVYGSIAQLGSLYTVPGWRGRGAATSLIVEAFDPAAAHVIDTAVVFVREDNEPACALYEALGGIRVGHFGLIWE